MSKFQRNKNDNVSESDSESDSSSEDNEENKEAGTPAQTKTKKYYNQDSDDSDDDKPRVVVSNVDKRTEAIKEIFAKTRNLLKIEDWKGLEANWTEINKEMDKCVDKAFATDKNQTLPGWVLKQLLELKEAVDNVTNQQKKAMKKDIGKSHQALKTRIVKYLAENGDQDIGYFAGQLEKYKADPSLFGDDEAKKEEKDDSDEDDDDSDSDSDEDSSSGEDDDDSEEKVEQKKEETKKEKPSAAKTKKDENDSDEGSDSGSDSSDSKDSQFSSHDSDSSDDNAVQDIKTDTSQGKTLPKKYAFLNLSDEQRTPEQRRWKWVLYKNLPDDMKPFIKNKNAGQKKESKAKPVLGAGETKKDKIADEIEKTQTIIQQDKDLDFTKMDNVELILRKYKNSHTNKRNFDKAEQVEVIHLILEAQKANQNVMIETKMVQIQTYFAGAKETEEGCFSRNDWVLVSGLITEFIGLLKNKKLNLNKQPQVESPAKIEGETVEAFTHSNDTQILPALVNFLNKIDQQLHKAFQSLESTSLQYLYRLRDECSLIKLCDTLIAYLTIQNDQEKIASISLIKLDHIYYKHDDIYNKTKDKLKNDKTKLAELYFPEGSTQTIVQELVDIISVHLTGRQKVKALLLQCYHHAIHNRYFVARDLLMKSRIGRIIPNQPIGNQVHYNRAFVQIGLSAFRLGLFDECNNILIEVCQSPRLSEILAQGSNQGYKQQEKTLEEEIEEKKRFVPHHLHLNKETIDCVFMTTSMFLEIPNLSENKVEVQKHVISRNFRKLIEQYDQKGIQFSPQNSRDFIVFAARNLYQSKWREAYDNICQIKVINCLAEFQNGSLKNKLEAKLKETAMNIYIVQSQSHHQSFSLSVFEDQFKLEKSQIIKQVGKLLQRGVIIAKIDQATSSLVFENQSGTGSQKNQDRKEMEHLLSQNLDFIKSMVESNERSMSYLINQNQYI